MWDFEHGEAARDFDISYTLPSACARSLQAGAADIGIIPAAAYAQIPGLSILPDVAIASRQPVRSILLVSRMPVEKIRTVALDTSSMTSVALTKVLFEKWLGGGRAFAPMAPDIDKMLAAHDAGLLIGDPALQIDRSRYFTLDLGRRMDSLHRQAFRLCLLGGSPRRDSRRRPIFGPGGSIPTIPRSRPRTRKPRSHLRGVGSKIRDEPSRCSFLSHRKYLLPSRRSLPGRLATLLSLRG